MLRCLHHKTAVDGPLLLLLQKKNKASLFNTKKRPKLEQYVNVEATISVRTRVAVCVLMLIQNQCVAMVKCS